MFDPAASLEVVLREKHVARAWIVASISAGLTVIVGIFALVGTPAAPEFDAWILLDAGLLGALAFGVARRSRTCGVLLVIYAVSNEAFMTFDGRNSVLRLIFIYFYIRGAIALFQDHRARQVVSQPTQA